jgi:ABC-type nitrate/sulfonate/bicarbonate transport system substrate-binding protein
MSRAEASGAMMSLADEEIQKRGFKVLAKSEDYVQHYARGLGATRREWANKNEDLLVRYTRAMIRATDWLTDPKNKEEAIAVLMPENRNNQARAEAVYRDSVSPRFGFTPRSQIDIEGIRSVIELREVAGLMKPPVPKPEKYVDERFYKKALATLDR